MSVPPPRRLALVFTDIVGSTQLAQRLGPEWPAVIRRHRELARGGWRAHDGREIDTAGDGFFVVFESSGPAVAAAVAVQRSLLDAPWPDGASVRVRAGVHVGYAVEYDGSLVGYEVHRAARITAAAHGGQVLVSAVVAREVGTASDGPDFLDLGRHPLKDLAADEHLFQVVATGLPRDFPAVRAEGPGGAGARVPSTLRNSVAIPPGELVLPDGRTVPMTGYGLRIGRTPDNDLVLTDGAVSRHHCAITATNGGFIVTDLQSTHGTTVSGIRLTRPRLLADGDVLGVGASDLAVRWPV